MDLPRLGRNRSLRVRVARAHVVGHNRGVGTAELAPRRSYGGVIAVWVVAALVGIAVGTFTLPEWRAPWLIVGFGLCVLLSFIVQLWSGRAQGFIQRVAASALGALFVMGIISLGFGLATIA